MKTYLILDGPAGGGHLGRSGASKYLIIRCLRCGLESINEHDLRLLYCVGCNRYHNEPEGFTSFVRAIERSIMISKCDDIAAF